MIQLTDALNNNNLNDFAMIMFDVNNLKSINDIYGHDMGDLYLTNSCKMICDFFRKSPVFRIGGDEFVAILKDDDYNCRNELLESMRRKMNTLQTEDIESWKKVSIASGMTEYIKGIDTSISDVIKRADRLMYENKKQMK